MSKHTPGPWRVELVKGSYKRPALVMSGDKLVASCLGDQLDPSATSIGEATANARLIAAAPDMLKALQALILKPEIGAEDLRRAHAAIAKAEGQS